MKLRNDNVLIFGGGSGIGKAIAIRFIAEGARVCIAGRTEAKLQAVLEEVKSDHLTYVTCDISDVDNHMAVFEKASEKLGAPVTAFVNDAGIGTGVLTGRGYEPWDITSEEWDILSDTNYKGNYFLLRNEVDYFLDKQIRGNILTIASNAACMDIIGSYGSAKLSLIKWTRAFGKKYGHNGIIINGIAPGATFTDMIARYAKDINQKYERHAIERFIRTDEMAELAFYLMSDYGEIVCGHTVVADGGDNAATL